MVKKMNYNVSLDIYVYNVNYRGKILTRFITVCMVVQIVVQVVRRSIGNDTFWGCCHVATRSLINTQFLRGNYVGEATQHAKWYINRLTGVSSRKGWNITPLCLFFIYFCVRSLAQIEVIPLDRFWRMIPLSCVSASIAFLHKLNNKIAILGGQNPQNCLKSAQIGIFQPKRQTLTTSISPKLLIQSSQNLKQKLKPRYGDQKIQN